MKGTRGSEEIAACWDRAYDSLDAARGLLNDGFCDFAASRAYYAAFYAASAVLLSMGLEFSKHSGTLSAVNRHLVKPGTLDKHIGKSLRWLFEIRGVGDYGVIVHVSSDDAARAIQCAGEVVAAFEKLRSQTDV